jgi:hypothetical protein
MNPAISSLLGAHQAVTTAELRAFVLEVGQELTATIMQMMDDSLVKLDVGGGRQLIATLQADQQLAPGQTVQLVAADVQPTQITLRLLTPDAAEANPAGQQALAAAGLPDDALNRAALLALVSEGLPASADAIQELRQAAAALGATTPEDMQAIAYLMARDLPVSSAFLSVAREGQAAGQTLAQLQADVRDQAAGLLAALEGTSAAGAGDLRALLTQLASSAPGATEAPNPAAIQSMIQQLTVTIEAALLAEAEGASQPAGEPPAGEAQAAAAGAGAGALAAADGLGPLGATHGSAASAAADGSSALGARDGSGALGARGGSGALAAADGLGPLGATHGSAPPGAADGSSALGTADGSGARGGTDGSGALGTGGGSGPLGAAEGAAPFEAADGSGALGPATGEAATALGAAHAPAAETLAGSEAGAAEGSGLATEPGADGPATPGAPTAATPPVPAQPRQATPPLLAGALPATAPMTPHEAARRLLPVLDRLVQDEGAPAEAVTAAASLRQTAERLVHVMQFQQLDAMLQPTPAEPYFALPLPVPPRHGQGELWLYVRDGGEGGGPKIDPDDVRLAIELRLSQLKRVSILVHAYRGQLSCQMEADTLTAQRLLEAKAPELRDGLRELGYAVDPIRCTVAGPSQRSAHSEVSLPVFKLGRLNVKA